MKSGIWHLYGPSLGWAWKQVFPLPLLVLPLATLSLITFSDI